MKTKKSMALFLWACSLSLTCCFAQSVADQTGEQQEQQKPKPEQFSAMAFLPHGAGRRMVGAGSTANLNIYVNAYTNDDDTQRFAGTLIDGGPDVLLKALEKAKPVGRISLVGRVGFYDLKLIRSRATETGRLLIAVTDRPIGFLEAYYANPSQDYKFGILMLELKKNKKGKEEGQGSLIYSAKIKIDGNKVEIENYGIEPIRLMNVRKF